MATDATIRLEQFEGPLDLLLHLIRRQELDISEIAVASITDQYLAFLETLTGRGGRLDVDEAADFLVTAATLIELKSRTVGAEPESDEESSGRRARDDAGDPAAELIRSLLAYKAYRDAADVLADREAEWAGRHPTGKAAADRAALVEALGDADVVEDVELFDLVEAFRHIAETVQFERLGEHEVMDDETPLDLHKADLLDQLRTASARDADGLMLAEVFAGRRRGEVIGLFLALLEVVRQRLVHVVAPEDGEGPGSLRLRLRAEDASDHPGDDARPSADGIEDESPHT
ncbi:MAG: segregation/condensation protein A [Planctomycetota bacterium]